MADRESPVVNRVDPVVGAGRMKDRGPEPDLKEVLLPDQQQDRELFTGFTKAILPNQRVRRGRTCDFKDIIRPDLPAERMRDHPLNLKTEPIAIAAVNLMKMPALSRSAAAAEGRITAVRSKSPRTRQRKFHRSE